MWLIWTTAFGIQTCFFSFMYLIKLDELKRKEDKYLLRIFLVACKKTKMGKPSVDKWTDLVQNILNIITFNVRTEKNTFYKQGRIDYLYLNLVVFVNCPL